MSSELTAGIVGLGWIAGAHLDVLARLGGVKVTAVCDTDEARASEVSSRLGAANRRSWQELLDTDQPDLLWVCIPPGAHRDPAVAALERGVHVYLEKPIARTPADAERIVAAAAASKAVCAVGYQWHALDLVDATREALDGQAVGMAVGLSMGPTFGRPWFLKRSESGGNLLERGSHQVDLIRAVAGDVVAVHVVASALPLAQAAAKIKGDIEDGACVLMSLRDGGVATIAVAWLKDGQPGRYSLDVMAADATLHMALDPDFILEGVSRGRPVQVKSATPPLEASITRFLEAVRTGNPALVACAPADAARTLAVVTACERSLDTGQPVAVDQ